jgi:ribosomal protein L11 methyltransferase
VRRLGVRVRRTDAEVVLAALLDLAPAGLEERDVDAQTVEYVLYGDSEALPSDGVLQELAGRALIGLDHSEVADDWAVRWREFHRPLVLADRLSVRPPWEPAPATALDLVIDPGQAFGTGAHATTRLCLELLLDQQPRASVRWPSVIDLGCGSGVLAIAAAKLGHGPVLALDNDPLAVAATVENAAVNGVAELVSVRYLDLSREAVPPAPLVLANLLAPLLLAWAQAMPAPEHEQIIASGLLEREAQPVSSAFALRGYREQRRRLRDGWAALLLQAPRSGAAPTGG